MPDAARSTEWEETAFPDLPWAALPGSSPGSRPIYLAVPRLFAPAETGPYPAPWDEEATRAAIGTTLWSSEYGDLLVGVSVEEEEEEDPLLGNIRKRYSAVFALDQPLGFSTALIVDVLSKEKRRGQKRFKLFQIAVTHPFAEDGNVTAGGALLLDGLDPELNVGIRLYLPLGGP